MNNLKNDFERLSVNKNKIEILGARENNLKNIDLVFPKNKLIVFTGISGSGKSSLAFDTIYAEGQRRYMESFSAYARTFIGNLERPNVDKINGLSYQQIAEKGEGPKDQIPSAGCSIKWKTN